MGNTLLTGRRGNGKYIAMDGWAEYASVDLRKTRDRTHCASGQLTMIYMVANNEW